MICGIIVTEVIIVRITTSKSKNSESFYITQSYTNANGKSTSKTIRKLGTLAELSAQLHTDRDGVVEWANEQARLETLKYKSEKEDATVMIPFHSNRLMDYNKQKLFSGGYLFLQSIYYGLKLDSVCRKIKSRHKFEYDLNAILSDLIYTRVLEPSSKSSSFRAAKQFLEPPTYELHDVYRALSVLASEMDFIQSEVYKNSFFLGDRMDRILYYDCTNYYFEIEQEDGDKKYGKSKEHRPNPIIQMGLFTDGDKNQLYYKDEPFTTKKLDQRLIITYSPKYAAYQKAIRAEQICRAEKMVANDSLKKQRKNPNDPARFVNKVAVTNEGEKAKIHYYLDTDKIAEEEMYDGLYAVCTDLLDDDVADILKVSEGRWQIEDCFRTMKTDFEARPVYLNREDRIKAHFLTCFLALLHFRLLNRSLKGTYTTEQLLHTLKDIKFTDIEEQGFMPVYERQEITDDLHETCGFRTDYQFITKRKMKGIQKKSKRR